MKRHHPLALISIGSGLLSLLCPAATGEDAPRSLLAEKALLGVAGQPEWDDFATRPPDSAGLEIDFAIAGPANAPHSLLIRHRGVKLRWRVQLNDKDLGSLPTLEQEQITAFAVPPGALVTGMNRLALLPPPTPDDIEIAAIDLLGEPVEKATSGSTLEVVVTHGADGSALPCRITVTTPDGALIPLRAEPAGRLAIREGVVYTGDGRARIELRPGQYTVWASRGFEWSHARLDVEATGGKTIPVALSLTHEVPLPGWISVDSHIHTLTDSGHGDATIDERQLTIAGEGIDLAIATDHNHHADYAPAVERTGTAGLFQYVTGNEVTTKLGHFNAFPILPGTQPVDHTVDDWERLLPGIRAMPGVRVVILNHPRNLHSGFVPMGPTQFDTVTGRHRREAALRGLDGFEVVTSAAMQSDIRLLFRDWFALLNRGHRIAAVGSSDTHDVNRFLLGQARTYVAAEENRVAAGDLASVWQGYEDGKMLVSMGLVAEIAVAGTGRVGDLIPATGGTTLPVVVTVTGPSWTRADRIELYANGHLIRQTGISHPDGAIEKARQVWEIPVPAHDTHFVAIATGPGVDLPFAETPRPYQPTSRTFEPRVIGATNPVWLDADADGAFSAARGTAERLIKAHGTDPARLLPALAGADEAIAIQAAALCVEAGAPTPSPDQLAAAGDSVRRAFESVFRTAP